MTFLTLFLGLVTGVHPVELTVTDPLVARIELRLDGRAVGMLAGAPWTLTADFGDDLEPHELSAVGFDDKGEEVAKVRQWINMPRDRAEVALVLEGDREGQVEKARLVWSSVDVVKPETAKAFLDGVEIEGIDPQGFAIPSYDVSIPHLLQAELELGDTTVRTQTMVGGGSRGAASGALTAIPLYLEEDSRLPTVAEMQGWLKARGEPLRVFAVERSGADVIMVQDLAWYLQRRLKGLRNEMLKTRVSAIQRPTGLKSRDIFRLLFPIPQTADATIRSLQFPMSPNMWSGQIIETHAQGATDRQVAGAIPQGLMVGIPVNGERKLDTSNQHLTDAIAVGALAAAQGQRARVMLMIAGSKERDHSRYTPAQVRSYLARLNVPLRVWSPEPEKVDPGWGEVQSIGTHRRLERAIRDLRHFLDRQIVVWVEGQHLPQQIQLTEVAAGRLQRITDVGPPPPPPAEDADLDPGLKIAAMPPGASAPASPTATPTPATAPAPAAEPASFVEAVDVNVVNVDVIVTSKDGTRARDLTQADFRLFEDGEPVEISYFEGPPVVDPAASEGATMADVVARPMSLVVYLDLFRLSPKQRARTLKALETGLALDRGPVRVMILVDDGSVEIPLTFTEDRDAIQAAIVDIEARKRRAYPSNERDAFREMVEVRESIRAAHSLRDEEELLAALRSAFVRRRSVEGMLPTLAEESMREIRGLVASLERLALGLSGVDGRRAILYVGNRLSMSPGQQLYEEAANLMADYSVQANLINGAPEDSRQTRLLSEVSRLRLEKDFHQMIRETSATGVTFYTLTPPNLEDADSMWREIPSAAGRPASARTEETKAAACAMSGETGGLCQVAGTDMDQLMQATFDDFGAYYSLAFTPDREPDGAFRKIRVEVDRPGLELRYREGYLDRPREDAVKDRLLAALTFGDAQDELGMQLSMEAPQATAQEGMFLIPFEVRVSATRLALLPMPSGGKRQAKARLMITAMDDRGRSIGIQEYPIQFEVSEERLATGQPLLYAHKVRLTLAGGEQTLAVGLWDDVGRVGSFVSHKLDVGASAKPEA